MEEKQFDTRGIATKFIPFDEVDKVFWYMDHPEPDSKKMVILF